MAKVIKSKSTTTTDKNSKGSAASAKPAAAVASKAKANPRVVEAFRAVRDAKEQAKTALIALGEIAQNEQCSRPELVLSYMEAHAVEKSTAEGQVSRMLKLLTDPEILEKLRTGEIDLKTARDATTKKQVNPSATKKKANIEARFGKAITTLVEAAKDGGMDRKSVLNAIKAALDKAGV